MPRPDQPSLLRLLHGATALLLLLKDIRRTLGR